MEAETAAEAKAQAEREAKEAKETAEVKAQAEKEAAEAEAAKAQAD